MTANAELAEHAAALLPEILPLQTSLEAETYGGAMLLGTNGVCIISHGSSSPTAINNAIGVARDMVDQTSLARLRQRSNRMIDLPQRRAGVHFCRG